MYIKVLYLEILFAVIWSPIVSDGQILSERKGVERKILLKWMVERLIRVFRPAIGSRVQI